MSSKSYFWVYLGFLQSKMPQMFGKEVQLLPSSLDSRPSFRVRVRKLQKGFRNLPVTILCGLLTIVVLRGTIGAGNFGTPQKDFLEFREKARLIKAENRVLVEATEKKSMPAEWLEFEPYSLGPKITDWDEQRADWLKKNSPSNSSSKILLISGSQPSACPNGQGDHYLLKSVKNKLDYSRIYDIDFYYNMAFLDSQMVGFWSKLPLIRKVMLANPKYEWIWWMDSDALITDMAFKLPMEKYKDHNLVLHGWKHEVYQLKNWVGANTGIFLLRNCQWSLDLLDAWAPMGPQGKPRQEAGKMLTEFFPGRPDFEADDQSALIYLLATQRSKWEGKVFLEDSYYLHGFWVALVDRFERYVEESHPGFGDQRWPFVVHFVGCKTCGGNGDYPIHKCITHMERAFNLADNQILEIYGLQHQDLSSPLVHKGT